MHSKVSEIHYFKTQLQGSSCFFLTRIFVLYSGNKSSDIKEELEANTGADSDNTNHPPPAKLLQDWARTPLPHVCPYCGKTFTRRVFLRTHVYSHTGEKLFTCKVPIKHSIRVSLSRVSGMTYIFVVQKTLMR